MLASPRRDGPLARVGNWMRRGGSAMATTSETRSAIDWDAVFAAVEEKEGALLERLRRIIRVDNSVPPGRNYDTLVDLVEPEFRRYGFQTERVVIPEERWRAIPLPL